MEHPMNQPIRQSPQFSVVDEGPEPSSTATPAGNDVATAMLSLALRALSQRAVIAVASLFTLLTCATVFWLALVIIPKPDVMQLIALGAYAVFVVGLNIIVRRK